MRQVILLFGLGLIIGNNVSHAQEAVEFGIVISSYNGTAVLEQKREVDLNGFIRNGGEITARILWKEAWGVYLGAATYSFQTNTVNQGENAHLGYHYIMLPFGISYCIPLMKKVEGVVSPLRLQVDLGGYAGNLIKAKEEARDVSMSTANLGWNLGISGKLGIEYRFVQKFSFGLGIQTRRDLSDIKEQKIVQSNAFYANLGYRFR